MIRPSNREPEDKQNGHLVRRPSWRSKRCWLSLSGIAAFLLVVWPFLSNNFSWDRLSQPAFLEQVDRSLERSFRYLESRTDELAVENPNTALLYMIRDMARMTGDGRLQSIVDHYIRGEQNPLWRRLVQPDAELTVPERKFLGQVKYYQQWILFALADGDGVLSNTQRDDLFSPDKYRARDLTHQLFALNLFRERGNGLERLSQDEERRLPQPEDVAPDGSFRIGAKQLNRLIETLCRRTAWEATIDFRVRDMYLQRVAFVLAAGQPDLVRPRWVEKAMAHQRSDGTWCSGWRPPGLAGNRPASDHATVQGAWLLAMVKYRYPEWVAEHYR